MSIVTYTYISRSWGLTEVTKGQAAVFAELIDEEIIGTLWGTISKMEELANAEHSLRGTGFER